MNLQLVQLQALGCVTDASRSFCTSLVLELVSGKSNSGLQHDVTNNVTNMTYHNGILHCQNVGEGRERTSDGMKSSASEP